MIQQCNEGDVSPRLTDFVRVQVLAKKKHGAPLVPINPESLQKIFKTVVVAVAVPSEMTVELVIENRNPRYRTYIAGSNPKFGRIVDFILKTEMNDCAKANIDSLLSLVVGGERVFTQSFRQTCPTTASRRTKNGDLPLELFIYREASPTAGWSFLFRPIEEQIPTSFFLDISFNTSPNLPAQGSFYKPGTSSENSSSHTSPRSPSSVGSSSPSDFELGSPSSNLRQNPAAQQSLLAPHLALPDLQFFSLSKRQTPQETTRSFEPQTTPVVHFGEFQVRPYSARPHSGTFSHPSPSSFEHTAKSSTPGLPFPSGPPAQTNLPTSLGSSFSTGITKSPPKSQSSNSFMVNSAQGPRSILSGSGETYPFSVWPSSSGRFSV